MSTRVWQRLLFALSAFALVLVAIAIPTIVTTTGFDGLDTDQLHPFVDVVSAVGPGTPAASAGFRVGDTIDLRSLSPSARYWIRNEHSAGTTLELTVHRGTRSLALRVTESRYFRSLRSFIKTQAWTVYLRKLGTLWLVCFAAFLAWRRPESATVRLLSLSLLLVGLSDNLGSFDTFPSAGLDVSIDALRWVLIRASTICLLVYSTMFGRPVSRFRLAMTWIAASGLAILTFVTDYGMFAEYFGVVDTAWWFAAHRLWLDLQLFFPPIVPTLTLLLAVFASRGNDRARITWAIGAYLALPFSSLAVHALTQFHTGFEAYFPIIPTLAFFIAPAGYTYSLLGRRLLDVGFVLNRAAVFTGVSLIVVSIFILVESLIGNWLQSLNKTSNIVVNSGLALGLGLAIYPIHTFVDKFVDRAIFRKRHDAEGAIRAFGHEAPFITDEATLVERAIALLKTKSGCLWAKFVLDENDPAFATMQSSRKMVDLRAVPTALGGEFAFPMRGRDRFIGALILGEKDLDEPYAPDELEAIAELAHGVGVAIDLIEAKRLAKHDPLLDTIHELERSNASMLAANERIMRELEELRAGKPAQ